MKTLFGKEEGRGVNIAVVAARFNREITQKLLDACCAELLARGVSKAGLTVAWVPGAFEAPLAAVRFARKKNIDAVICLGAVIKGDTDHYEHVARESARAIMDVALASGKPVVYEILACRTLKQAQDRAKIKGYNKGRTAALAALEMVSLMRQINGR